MPIDLYIGGALLLVIAIGALTVRRLEKKEWNNGICAKSNRPWISTDMASDGSRYYTDGVGNSCWISYNVDKKAHEQPYLGQLRNPYQRGCSNSGSVSNQCSCVRSRRNDN